jgi:hypothetical protein
VAVIRIPSIERRRRAKAHGIRSILNRFASRAHWLEGIGRKHEAEMESGRDLHRARFLKIESALAPDR